MFWRKVHYKGEPVFYNLPAACEDCINCPILGRGREREDKQTENGVEERKLSTAGKGVRGGK